MSSTPENTVPANHQSFLAFDYGLKRTGVAVGNRLMKSATPQGTIAAEGDARFEHIAKRIKEWQPDAFIIEKKAAGAPLIQELRQMGMFIEEISPSRGARGVSGCTACTRWARV